MKYNVDKIINALMSDLSPRQKDILYSRYGTINAQPLTLAKIGGKYNVTRERVRQIESLSLKSVKAKFSKGNFNGLVNYLKNHLNNRGGLCNETLLCEELSKVIGGSSVAYKNKINFLLESCGAFNYHPEDKDFHAFWYLDKKDVKKAEDFINKLVTALKSKKDNLNNKKPSQLLALNYISISKKFNSNSYNDFGLSAWPEICPKTSRDWAYLMLRKKNEPLHFTALTVAINKLRKNKTANPQTVHNELIKDNRFVLVGRGTYGLKEFNLMAGTAREVIVQILKKHGPQPSKNLVQLVLNQRMFKENTLLLNLQDKKFFQRLGNGKYTIREV